MHGSETGIVIYELRDWFLLHYSLLFVFIAARKCDGTLLDSEPTITQKLLPPTRVRKYMQGLQLPSWTVRLLTTEYTLVALEMGFAEW